ncbi:hypothetical protein DX914_14225 [Lysobacter silvisoli]|uniref:DUF3955 domain-containing protein n=2 Tax=Lysobacter silvisoli TaxID=2293254 RepID=A0A371K0F9_9GAMM|nr:hypothetical protein DX914_14225 [Lysobacter silvisoli]
MLTGWACIALSFALVILIGVGVFDPVGSAGGRGSLTPVLVGLLPSVSFGIALFALGVWLITTARKP